MTAVTGKDPNQYYTEITEGLGTSHYERIDAPASRAQKSVLSKLDPAAITATTLAGEPIMAKLNRAPGNDAALGGIKLVTENGWFAALPSGTEDVYKIYAESFLSDQHLKAVQQEAQALIGRLFETL
jgi:phosphoglucomutase